MPDDHPLPTGATPPPEALQRENIRLKEELADLAAQARSAERVAEAAQRSYERLAGRRIVRLSLALTRPLRPLFDLARGRKKPVAADPVPAPAMTRAVPARKSREDVAGRIAELRPARHPVSGPLVTIIILTRDGAHHLRRLLPALDATRYRSFEVVVVDNASGDDTADVLGSDWSFPLRVVRNQENASFSEGNNQAAELAGGDLLLFLNNDVEPITDDWLGAMVATLGGGGGWVAVGALMVHRETGQGGTACTVQHRGIRFGFREGAPHATNIEWSDPTDPALVETIEVAAATGAALLVTRSGFEAVGGFTPGYVYGCEDLDLCLKLRRHGRIALAGEAVLFHAESSTRRGLARDVARINHMGNWRQYAETWGPLVSRSVRRARLGGQGVWAGGSPPKVAITITEDDVTKGWGDWYTAHELGDAFAAQGWEVVYAERRGHRWYELPDDVDVVIGLLDSFDVRRAPTGAVTIAWVRNWVERWMSHPWFDAYDQVVASSHLAAEALARFALREPPVLPLATNPERFQPGAASVTFRADYAFTGNNWGFGRSVLGDLDVRTGERFLLFGKNWREEPLALRYWRGHLPYELLPDVYRSVDILLDDTAHHTLPHGFVNSRVFDALACGTLVVSNNPIGSAELFGGLLPTYRDGRELRELLDRYLGDEAARRELADKLRATVLERHTYGQRAREFAELAMATVERPRVAAKVAAIDAEEAAGSNDHHVARSLLRAMETQGFAGEIHFLPDWDREDRQDVDVVVHLRGAVRYTPKSAQVNVLWITSHAGEVTPQECERYDLVCVASARAAERLAAEASVPVVHLPFAADGTQFGSAEPDPGLTAEVVYVTGASISTEQAPAAGEPVTSEDGDAVEDVEPPAWEGRLAEMYASAGVVVHRHLPELAEHGIVAPAVFDALASGAVVVSDLVEGLGALFDGVVDTYSGTDDLAGLVGDLLGNDWSRTERARRGRDLVLGHHTFAHRAQQISDLLRPLLAGRAMDCDGNTYG